MSNDNAFELSPMKSAKLSEIEEAEDCESPEPELSLREIFGNPLFYLLVVSYLIFTTYTDILMTVITKKNSVVALGSGSIVSG